MNKEKQPVINKFSEREIFDHPDLALEALSGSVSVKSNGRRSDIDITTVLCPENPKKVDVDAIIKLGRQLNSAANKFKSQNKNIHPIIISTIRLEEAQVAMGEIWTGKEILPIHWLHYPSVEFAALNEPPGLFEGLISGEAIKGNSNNILKKFEKVDSNAHSHLGGLDWLTDSFKVLISNIGDEKHKSLLPESFLKNLATHNLEYFWKWMIIAPIVKSQGRSFDGWQDIDNNQGIIPARALETTDCIRELRHSGVNAPLDEIIKFHKLTFNIWPIKT